MAIETAIGGTSEARPGLSGMIIAATIGNVLEWFDFLVYGFFAVTIAEVFFPASNPTVSLLITFGTFGLAYVARPLGAVILGTYTDRTGRKWDLRSVRSYFGCSGSAASVCPAKTGKKQAGNSRQDAWVQTWVETEEARNP
jgi:MFS family permease